MNIYKVLWCILLISVAVSYIVGTTYIDRADNTIYGYKSLAIEIDEPKEPVTTQTVLGSPDWTETELKSKYFESKKPILVNERNPIPYLYEPTLKQWADEIYMDVKAHTAFSDMWTSAMKDGESLWVISAYRSDEKQNHNFSERMNMYQNSGLTEEEAYNETVRTIASTGHSEHTLGLALDLNLLSVSFEESSAFRWLQKNATKYGFILRYPKGKENITGHSYEPWHYRYVGSNHASRIVKKGLTLEEYVLDENYYNPN